MRVGGGSTPADERRRAPFDTYTQPAASAVSLLWHSMYGIEKISRGKAAFSVEYIAAEGTGRKFQESVPAVSGSDGGAQVSLTFWNPHGGIMNIEKQQ